jgi:hypothetical protein
MAGFEVTPEVRINPDYFRYLRQKIERIIQTR